MSMGDEPCGAKTGKLNCGCCSYIQAVCERSKGHEGKHSGVLEDTHLDNAVLVWENE